MTSSLRSSIAILATVCLAAVAGQAVAAGKARPACDSANQNRRACSHETGAAAQAARRNDLTYASEDVYRQNALTRCNRFTGEDQKACENRVLGTGETKIVGDVMGGGLLRETVTRVTVQPGK